MLRYTYVAFLVQNKYESFVLYYSLNSEFIDKLDPTYFNSETSYTDCNNDCNCEFGF